MNENTKNDSTYASEIIGWFQTTVASQEPIAPLRWIEGAERLNLALSAERENYYFLQQKVAQMKAVLLGEGKTAAYARMMVEASDEYLQMNIQKGRIEQIVEFIRLAKAHGRLAQEELKNS